MDNNQGIKVPSENSSSKGKNNDKKSVGRVIFDVVFWVCIIALAVIWLTDFFRMRDDKEPVFCLSKKTHEFEDGTVDECIGLGYKIYDYHRESLNGAHQFSPFFVGMKE